MEIWKAVKGYEGLYEVSNLGNVRGLTANKVLKPHRNNHGYMKVDLYKNGNRKRFLVHRIVAETYIPNPKNYTQVNHKDENKTNNCVANLEFCDRKYNSNYGTAQERSAEKHKKAVFCNELNKSFKSITEAARYTGICLQSISMCCRGKYATAGDFHWRFE